VIDRLNIALIQRLVSRWTTGLRHESAPVVIP
jgi:hypothetical protein